MEARGSANARGALGRPGPRDETFAAPEAGLGDETFAAPEAGLGDKSSAS